MSGIQPTAAQLVDDRDEAALVAALRAGSDAAFERLLRDYGPRLLAVARRMMGNDDDANDALQDAMLSAFKSLDRFDGHSKLSTWLHRIVVNACLMKMRTRRRRPETSIEALLPAYLDDGHRRNPGSAWNLSQSSNPLPESGIEQSETRLLVRSCIDQLPEAYRSVLMLRDIEGLDTEETATVLEMTTNAVKTRLHRARQALRELLNPHMQNA